MRHPLASPLASVVFALGLGSSAGCSSSSFSGSDGAKSGTEAATPDPSSGETGPDGPDGGGPDGGDPSTECVDGDKVNIQWTGEQKECIVDKHQTYNFDTKACTKMPQSSFDCTWDSFFAEMDDRGIVPTDKMKVARDAGAKLVTCGQSSDGNRIVVQWLNPPEGGNFSCNAADATMPGLIVTGCYTKYKVGQAMPPAPKDKEEQKKQVFDCMNKL